MNTYAYRIRRKDRILLLSVRNDLGNQIILGVRYKNNIEIRYRKKDIPKKNIEKLEYPLCLASPQRTARRDNTHKSFQVLFPSFHKTFLNSRSFFIYMYACVCV